MKMILLLEDGTSFPGESFGAVGEATGWVHDERGVIGYQECLTDPDNRGCIVNMTYPLIGNYGVNDEDGESDRAQAAALLVKEKSRVVSNWRAGSTLEAFMDRWGVVGLEGVDTRALALHLREHGEMRGIVAPAASPTAALLAKVRADSGPLPADRPRGTRSHAVSARPFETDGGPRIAMLDFGCRRSYLRQLEALSCQVRSFSPTAAWEEIRRSGPDGLFLSNGPGAPEAFEPARRMLAAALGELPAFGIALGCQMLAIAAGGKATRMGQGHHGANYPVRDLRTGRTAMTLQNHGWVIDETSLKGGICTVSHRNLNDGTVEGVSSERGRFLGVQFSPVPDDDGRPSALFREFVERTTRTGGKRQKAKG
ncbi:MAG: carbamoyl phosphate synthase small subunit [Syntrophales bacterium]|nr:carbamoyl phosphate synthase small subunit [Syntrophales bacterium]